MIELDFPIDEKGFLAAIERAFAGHAGPDGRIDVESLQKALGLRNRYLAERLLTLLDRDGNGFITRDEFLHGATHLIRGTPREKLEFAFRLHDHDGDGVITREELLRMVSLGLAEDDLSFDESSATRLVDVLFAEADRNRDGRISFDEFEALMQRHPRILADMTRGEAKWLVPNEDVLERAKQRADVGWFRSSFENRRAAIAFVAIWVLVNLALFVTGMTHHGSKPTSMPDRISRAATSCILWNGAVVLVPILRRILTRLRRTRIASFLPIDDAIDLHRLVGNTLFFFVLVHATAMIDTYVTTSATTAALVAKLTTTRALTGMAATMMLTIMWIFSRRFVRHSNRFELFYFTHLLFAPLLVLAIVHAPAFLGWAGIGIVALGSELVARGVRRGRETSIVTGRALR
ncbi:MAG: EF-hand domain-containing protein, partial [Polyangiaceae bacterium]